MRKLIFIALALLSSPLWATVNVLATVPEWASLVRELGGERVRVYEATNALQDPHHIEARPSLIARVRSAQLVVAVGADLEIGWLPILLRESGNNLIQPGQPGYFEAAAQIRLRDVPAHVDRSMGDVHPQGDPHLHLDPRNIPAVARALSARLSRLDVEGAPFYQLRLESFLQRWSQATQRWEVLAAPLRGRRFLQQHRSFGYLANWLGLENVGELEPKPGVEPGSAYLASLVRGQQGNPATYILRAAYQADGAGRWVSEQTGIPLVTLPYTVGGSDGAQDLFGLFDDTLNRLRSVLR